MLNSSSLVDQEWFISDPDTTFQVVSYLPRVLTVNYYALSGTCAHPERIQLTIFLGFRSDMHHMLPLHTGVYQLLSRKKLCVLIIAAVLGDREWFILDPDPTFQVVLYLPLVWTITVTMKQKRHTIFCSTRFLGKYGTGILPLLRKLVKTTVCRFLLLKWSKPHPRKLCQIRNRPAQKSNRIRIVKLTPETDIQQLPHSTSHFSWLKI